MTSHWPVVLWLHEIQGLKLGIEKLGIPVGIVGEWKKREIILMLFLAQNISSAQNKISMSFKKITEDL